MKVPVLFLLLLLPLCSAQKFYIECYGHDHYMVINNLVMKCSGDTQQACYTRTNGDKGCTRLDNCSRDGWSCCHSNLCNA